MSDKILEKLMDKFTDVPTRITEHGLPVTTDKGVPPYVDLMGGKDVDVDIVIRDLMADEGKDWKSKIVLIDRLNAEVTGPECELGHVKLCLALGGLDLAKEVVKDGIFTMKVTQCPCIQKAQTATMTDKTGGFGDDKQPVPAKTVAESEVKKELEKIADKIIKEYKLVSKDVYDKVLDWVTGNYKVSADEKILIQKFADSPLLKSVKDEGKKD